MKLYLLIIGLFAYCGLKAQDFAEVKLADSLSISFDVGSSTVKNPAAFLSRINQLKLAYGKIKVIAYTDTVGTAAYNKNLASKRMTSVLKLIGSSNIKAFVIDTLNKNEERKKGRNNEETFRRVDVFVYSVKPAIKYNTPVNLKINFNSGTTTIIKNSIENLKMLEMILQNDTTVQVKLNGHVCCQPDLILSLNRAEKVKAYLMNHGINGKRITCYGYSNTVPLVPEKTDKDENRNMRVEVVFLKP
ncbi:OmpA family protein [uncultured Fluviicola sp.]|uniref:OmpA family protein n=1 Tax=uncultured Fluviicola sp. TaxID=463303 RepID=UPI0025F9E458|nr:OmpA family protein [uncultured Fluviicola sp.]